MTELAKARGNYVTIKHVYVVIELAKIGRIYVMIEDFRMRQSWPTTESSVYDKHARATRMRVGQSMAK